MCQVVRPHAKKRFKDLTLYIILVLSFIKLIPEKLARGSLNNIPQTIKDNLKWQLM